MKRYSSWIVFLGEVQQRGVPGTREILEAFVENLEPAESDGSTPIFICDMMLSKFLASC